jgi:solute-binding AdeT-like protein
MTKTTKRWPYFGVFIAALLTSAVLHWGWHLFGEGAASEQVAQGGAVVSVCLPPFCDEPPAAVPSERAPPTTVVHANPPATVRSHVDTPETFEVPQYPRAEVQQDPAGLINQNGSHQICVFDALGTEGMQFAIMQAWQQAALVEGSMRPALTLYASAQALLEEWHAGVCHAVWLPGELASGMIPSSTLQAFGGIPTADHARLLAQVLSSVSPSVEKWRSNDDYELMGLVFSGPAYLIFNKHAEGGSMSALLEGHRLATVNKAQTYFAKATGALPVPVDIENVATQFNNGSIDTMFATLHMIASLELNRGLAPDGAVFAAPMYQSHYQLVARKGAFTTDQQEWSRRYFFNEVAPQMEKSVAQEKEWLKSLPLITPLSGDALAREEMLQQVRLEIRAAEIYDAEILTLMRKVRCKLDASRRECVSPVE